MKQHSAFNFFCSVKQTRFLFANRLIEWSKWFVQIILASCDILASLEVIMLTFCGSTNEKTKNSHNYFNSSCLFNYIRYFNCIVQQLSVDLQWFNGKNLLLNLLSPWWKLVMHLLE